jgi:hypothetical protein
MLGATADLLHSHSTAPGALGMGGVTLAVLLGRDVLSAASQCR